MEILTDIASKIGFEWRLALTSLINFLIIFFLLVKFALPSIKKTIDERTKKIQEGLKMREDAKAIVDNAYSDAKEITKNANQKSQDIVSVSETNAKKVMSEAQIKKSEIIKEAELLKDCSKKAGLKEAENILSRDISNILTKISENAFGGKITAEVNTSFITKIFN